MCAQAAGLAHTVCTQACTQGTDRAGGAATGILINQQRFITLLASDMLDFIIRVSLTAEIYLAHAPGFFFFFFFFFSFLFIFFFFFFYL